MHYRGFDIKLTYDPDYPAPNNCLATVHMVEGQGYTCKWIEWAENFEAAETKAKAWIDELILQLMRKD
jgi:hypothetical protein